MWNQFHSVMIRNRSRSAMTTKQQAYSSSQSSSSSSSSSPSPTTQNYKRSQVPSFFDSPRFRAFTKALAETDVAAAATAVVTSPTSILDTKQLISPFCNNSNSFWDHEMITLNQPKSPKLFSENKHKGIGLVLIDVSTDDHKAIEASSSSSSSSSKPNNVLFGTKLRVQIPPLPTLSLKSPSGSANYCTESLSVTEMELSEEYTRVISHGPNPKTTHIFDNCIIESYCSLSDSDIIKSNNSAPENFLCFCYTCKKNLEQKNDIYIYRGERAFCSEECRHQEMLLDDQVEEN